MTCLQSSPLSGRSERHFEHQWAKEQRQCFVSYQHNIPQSTSLYIKYILDNRAKTTDSYVIKAGLENKA